jgi:protein involved in polysaccharide export with SLBB domain
MRKSEAGMKSCLAVALLMFSAATGGGQQAPSPTAGSAAVLAPGDLLRVVVWRRAELSGDFPIAVDGTIVHPLYRKIVAAGVPMARLEAQVRTFLLDYEKEPQFVIAPLFRVFVVGEVRQPTVLSVAPGTTMSQAVALAGGPTEDGLLTQVRLFRDLKARMIDLTSSDSSVARIELQSSDQITVGRRRRFIRDVLLPTASVISALASVVSVVLLTTQR